MELNRIYQADCLEKLKELPDNSIDLVVTDPPYNLSMAEWDRMISEKWKGLLLGVLKESSRILKDNGSIWIFGGWSNICELRSFVGLFFKERNWIIWDRVKGRGAKTNFVSTREDIIWATKSDNYVFNLIKSNKKKNWVGSGKWGGKKEEYRSLSNVWTDIKPVIPWSKEKVDHPTQKPIGLIERIIKISSNENDIVLDPFAGSCTTAVACTELGRKYICIEKEADYVKICHARLAVIPRSLFA